MYSFPAIQREKAYVFLPANLKLQPHHMVTEKEGSTMNTFAIKGELLPSNLKLKRAPSKELRQM